MMALLRFYGIQDKRGGGAMRNWESRFETSDRWPRATWRRTTPPNKPNRFNRHFSQVIQESCVGVASDSGRDDFMNLVNLVIKMPRADC
jgi:hypothetical protein